MTSRPKRSALAALALGALAASLWAPGAEAQVKTVRLAKQFGISYLPLTIMEDKKLLEEQAKKLGIEVKTEWLQLSAGSPMNEALISGNLDFASGGVGPLLTIWSRTRANLKVKGVAAINSMPIWLTTINPDVKTIKDFTEKDRIALPAVKVSIQAVTLQMAAEQAFGPGQHGRLDTLTVSMSHPDGMAAMMSGRSEVTGHFTSAPFQYQELADPRVRKVVDSYDVLGGPHTFNVVWAATRFRDENPKIVEAFVAALDEAMKFINANRKEAAEIWVRAENSRMPAAEAERIIRLPENEWTMTPKKVMAYADFMSRNGLIPARPESWKDLFFPEVHGLPGS
ncbi:MAG: ABC transporter substrate-binding protein [Microvirga sp.]|jgi:NitT/TauT family transport system substrate-binding protein|nr:ABC transporter substrate-binding protein [Beijerinckiaceae bacterium]